MDINVTYATSRNFSGWVGIMRTDQPSGIASQENALSYQNLEGSSGILKLKAPKDSGSYDLRLYNATSNNETASLKFMVKVPSIAATPSSTYTSEDIAVAYAGTPRL